MNADWKDQKENIGNLNLDLQNPRVPKHIKDNKDVDSIRNYLIERTDVLKIAESIADNGYHRSVTSIACKEGDKLIVLDGNRRLAACQLLLAPALAPSAYRKQFEKFSRQCDKNTFAEVKITVAPSRKAAEKEIWDIHVNPLLKPWEVLQKLRMYRNLIDDGEYDVNEAAGEYRLGPGEFKNELAKLHFFETISEVESEAEDVLLESGFNKIDRLLLSKNGKEYLSYAVNDDGKVIADDHAEHVKRLTKLIPYIIEPSRVPAQATQEWIRENVFAVLDPKNFSKRTVKKKTPKAKKAKKKTMVYPKCFVVMPLSGLDSVYEKVQIAWKTVFGKRAKVYHQGDDKSKGSKELIDRKILKNISSSTVVIGILSMGSKEKLLYDCIPVPERDKVLQKSFPINANVALEIGYSIRCADEGTDALKDYFLIADDSGANSAHKFITHHCFDLGHREIISYTEAELDKLLSKLIDYLKHFKQEHGL
jgi:ParB-like chromosome segregation protein Spo0J